jgi:hypothetical protein
MNLEGSNLSFSALIAIVGWVKDRNLFIKTVRFLSCVS